MPQHKLCPGSVKPVPSPRRGVRGGWGQVPAASRAAATPVWQGNEPWHHSGSGGDGALRQGTLSCGRETGGRAMLAACSCQRHYICFEKKTEEFNCQIYCSGNCNRNDSGSCQVTKLLLSSSGRVAVNAYCYCRAPMLPFRITPL